MGNTTLYLHKRDPVSKQRIPTLPFGLNARVQYIYQIRVGVSTTPNWGITWDGAKLWVSTAGEIASGTAPRLVAIDPTEDGFSNVPQYFITTDLQTDNTIKDIVWNGNGFYATVEKGGFFPTYRLVELDPSGIRVRTLHSSLLPTEAGIAWDGAFIYTSHSTAGLGIRIRVYDPVTGNRMAEYTTISGSSSGQGGGLVWDGAFLHSKSTVIPGTLDYIVYDIQPQGSSLTPVSVRSAADAFPATSNERGTLAWDGAFIWSLAQVT